MHKKIFIILSSVFLGAVLGILLCRPDPDCTIRLSPRHVNLKLLGDALAQYAAANEGRLPFSLDILSRGKLFEAEKLVCPGRNVLRYEYYGHGFIFEEEKLSEQIIVREAKSCLDGSGYFVLLLDGRVQWIENGIPSESRDSSPTPRK